MMHRDASFIQTPPASSVAPRPRFFFIWFRAQLGPREGVGARLDLDWTGGCGAGRADRGTEPNPSRAELEMVSARLLLREWLGRM